MTSDEEKNFQWAWLALQALAKRCLADSNANAEPGCWPAGQEWEDLAGSSQSIFMREARKEAGISEDEFIKALHSCKYELPE